MPSFQYSSQLASSLLTPVSTNVADKVFRHGCGQAVPDTKASRGIVAGKLIKYLMHKKHTSVNYYNTETFMEVSHSVSIHMYS